MIRARFGAIVGSKVRTREAAAAATKKKGQRSMTAAALIESHRELLESLSPQQYEALQAAFVKHGKTQAGFITAKELGPLLKAIGDNPRPMELQTLIAAVDADGNQVIDFQEFLVLVAIRSQHKHVEEDVLEAFRLFDPEGTGAVPASLFRGAMSHLAGMSDDELDSLMAEARAISRQEEVRRLELHDARVQRRLARKAPQLPPEDAPAAALDTTHAAAVTTPGEPRTPSMQYPASKEGDADSLVRGLFSAAATATRAGEEPDVEAAVTETPPMKREASEDARGGARAWLAPGAATAVDTAAGVISEDDELIYYEQFVRDCLLYTI